MKRVSIQVLAVAMVIWSIASLSSCANIVPPGGGPRDSLPPRLVMSTPRDSSLNVSTRQISLVFDEFVTLDNPATNLIVSPTLKNLPQFNPKLRNVTITLNKEDTLRPNTTYVFDFGDAVKDVNEGNIAHGLRYIFSTGSTIDYGTYSGRVVLAESGAVDSNMIVMLHRNLADSAVAKERPEYYTRVNGRGEFFFRNLPTGSFAVYALRKGVYNNVYTDTTNLFAFMNAPIMVLANTRPDTLYAFQSARKETQAPVGATPVKLPADKRLRYVIELDNGMQDILSPLNLTFVRRIAPPDTGKIVLYDTSYHKLSGYSVVLDSTRTRLQVRYPWKENTPYRVIIAKDAVSDTLGNTLAKTDTLKFTTHRESDYGSVRIRFPNIDLSKNPVLQIVQSDKLLESIPLTSNEFSRQLFRPGTYDLRILYDDNKNGIWDAGRFFKVHRQPEIVQRVPRQLSVRGNWDNELNITL
jgi:hypothetical protein